MTTNAQEAANRDQALRELTAKEAKLLIRNPWYKDGAGVIAVISWIIMLGLWVYEILTGNRIEEWWLLLAITTVAVVSSFMRW